MSSPPTARAGRIITFYSFKGGTGRSMAVANVAFVLASRGKRVLVVDWDLEAPGLHRYFRPFLDDPELVSSPGLIDYFTDFAAAALSEARFPRDDDAAEPWWSSWSSLLRYTYPLAFRSEAESDSPSGGIEGFGTVDFIPAGRQGADYATKVHGFDWEGFYTRLGGGVLLEAVKNRLRERYDYVLVDSRTGISDTSGICTVQLPDDLVVCCTLNSQSMMGGAAVASSVAAQRRKESGAPGVKIWPVPMRVELAERDRLEAARETMRTLFARHVMHLSRSDRQVYWGRIETLYHPYFAYEEVLAVFAERRHRSSSLLASYEFLCSSLTNGETAEMAVLDEGFRRRMLAHFDLGRRDSNLGPSIPESTFVYGGSFVYVGYRRGIESERDRVERIASQRGMQTWSDAQVLAGESFESASTQAARSADLMVALISNAGVRAGLRREINLFRSLGKPIVPVLLGAGYEALPRELRGVRAIRLPASPKDEDYEALLEDIKRLRERSATKRLPVDPEDPQKGQWGGRAERNGRRLSASVRAVAEDWFAIQLRVESTGDRGLSGPIVFHLHPTFSESVVTVEAVSGVATLRLEAYGAFTVGVEADAGLTALELDLSLDETFPIEFRRL